MLERDVNNIRGTSGRFAPELLTTEYAREIWALFEAGELQAESKLTGVFARDESAIDPDAVMVVIEDAREEKSAGNSAARVSRPSRIASLPGCAQGSGVNGGATACRIHPRVLIANWANMRFT